MLYALQLVWWVIGVRGAMGAWPLPASRVCDSTCQSAQRAALFQLSNGTTGQSWTRPLTSTDSTILSSSALGLVPADWPEHCLLQVCRLTSVQPAPACCAPLNYVLWQGISCCLPAGHLLSGAGAPVPCDEAYAVVAVHLSSNGLSGQLPAGIWGPLAPSLTRLALACTCAP